MSAMDFLFESIPLTISLLVAIPMFSAILFKSSVIFRSILFSNLIWIAAIYYFLYIFVNKQFNSEIYLALLVELFILFIYIILFNRLLKVTSSCENNSVVQLKKWLKVIIAIYLVLYIPFFFQDGFGLFSDGSRIQYFENSRFSRYSTFLIIVLGNIGQVISAAIINREKCWDKVVLLFLFILLGGGLLAGSKGGFVLGLLSLLSLVQMSRIKDYIRLLMLPILACVVTIVSTVIFVGNFMSLDNTQMMNLMFTRIFLSNDSRALSIDFAPILNQGGASLFQEAFRGLFSLIGFPPSNLPLGQLLYRIAFSTESYSGGNTTSTSLLIAYGNDYEKILFAFCICTLSFMVFFLVHKSSKLSKFYIAKLVIGILLIIHLSQDLLVVPLITNMLLVFMLIYYLFMRTAKRLFQCVSIPGTTPDPIKQT